MNELEKKSILEMSMGAILERVDYEMGRVIDNILDPNTKPTGKRKITVGLELNPQRGPQDHHRADHSQEHTGPNRSHHHQPLYHQPAEHR